MREINVLVSDDLDYAQHRVRNTATVTLSIGLNGTWRELDLTEANEKMIRETLEPWLTLGREPEQLPVPPSVKHKHAPIDPEQVAFFKGLREWCHEKGLRNRTGSGWAYQTNQTKQIYYGEPLLRKYRAYLKSAEQEKQEKQVKQEKGK